MSRGIPWLLACVAGVALGSLFFGGLWWTTKRLFTSRRPALLVAGSFLVRMAVVGLGLYFVSNHRWDRGVACAIGLTMARTLVGRRVTGAHPVAAPPWLHRVRNAP
jgi:F1F0 ATPase subunit 2